MRLWPRKSEADTGQRTVYFLCPDQKSPTGGIKVLYRQVDFLNDNGFRAFVVHKRRNYKITWFEHHAPVVRYKNIFPTSRDFIVMPEVYGPRAAEHFRGTPKVIFSQNCYYTFDGYGYDPRELVSPYLDPEVVATFINSDDGYEYMRRAFPNHRLVKFHPSVSPKVFPFRPLKTKKKLISFMLRKHPLDSEQVISLLKFRGLLKDFEIMPIHHRSEKEVAEIFGDTLLFLCFGYPEGQGTPPLEAMLSGCSVVGYHGGGGKEFFKPEFSRPIEINDIHGFADAAQAAIEEYRNTPDVFEGKIQMAYDFVKREYSPEREQNEVLTFWREVLAEG